MADEVQDEKQEVEEKPFVILRGESGVEQKHDLPLSNGIRDLLLTGKVNVVSDDPEEQERLTKELTEDAHEKVTRVQALGGALERGVDIVTDDGKPVVVASAAPEVTSDPDKVLATKKASTDPSKK